MKHTLANRRISKLNNTVKQSLLETVVSKKDYKISDNHYLFADPRGGSTWLMEIIQTITNEPVLWEPLHLGSEDNPFNKIGFGWRQHIPADAEWKEAKDLFDKLFRGEILIENIFEYSSYSQLLNSESLLFKICRGSALLPWLTNNFPLKNKPIYLIRHPFAVVSSQLRHGAWNYPFTEFEIPKLPHYNLYTEHESFLKTIKTKEEALTAEWCLSNRIPLNHTDNNSKWLTISYEEFVLNPEKTIDRILQSWGIDYDLSKIDFKKSSVTSKDDRPDIVTDRLSKWQTNLSKEQVESMGRVLDYFDIDYYSKDNPLPEGGNIIDGM